MLKLVAVGTLGFLSTLIVLAVPSANAFPFAVGGGVNAAGEKFSLSAHDGPNGPSGHARIDFPPSGSFPQGFTVQGHVTCFTLDAANAARFGIEIEQASSSTLVGMGFVFAVIDNGNPGNVGPDLMGTGFTATPPTVCPAQGAGTAIIKGNIVVNP